MLTLQVRALKHLQRQATAPVAHIRGHETVPNTVTMPWDSVFKCSALYIDAVSMAISVCAHTRSSPVRKSSSLAPGVDRATLTWSGSIRSWSLSALSGTCLLVLFERSNLSCSLDRPAYQRRSCYHNWYCLCMSFTCPPLARTGCIRRAFFRVSVNLPARTIWRRVIMCNVRCRYWT
jgi:hypothetical protein